MWNKNVKKKNNLTKMLNKMWNAIYVSVQTIFFYNNISFKMFFTFLFNYDIKFQIIEKCFFYKAIFLNRDVMMLFPCYWKSKFWIRIIDRWIERNLFMKDKVHCTLTFVKISFFLRNVLLKMI